MPDATSTTEKKSVGTPITVIEVTADHIARGLRANTTHNPITLAVRDEFPDAFVSVSYANDIQSGSWFSLSIQSHRASLMWTLPPDIRKILEDYYRTGEMEPFIFTIFL